MIRRLAVTGALSTLLAVPLLLAGVRAAPVPFDALVGSCPAPTADPTSVCYSPDLARARAAVESVQALRLEAAAGGCWAPGSSTKIPGAAIMRSPAGDLRLEPFAQAWSDAGHGWWTVKVCAHTP